MKILYSKFTGTYVDTIYTPWFLVQAFGIIWNKFSSRIKLSSSEIPHLNFPIFDHNSKVKNYSDMMKYIQ